MNDSFISCYKKPQEKNPKYYMQRMILVNQIKDWFLRNKQNNLNIGFPATELSLPGRDRIFEISRLERHFTATEGEQKKETLF